jgi:hypothetical protein
MLEDDGVAPLVRCFERDAPVEVAESTSKEGYVPHITRGVSRNISKRSIRCGEVELGGEG